MCHSNNPLALVTLQLSGIAQQGHGQVQVKSTRGRGTAFRSAMKANCLTLIGPKCSIIRHTRHLHYFQITLTLISILWSFDLMLNWQPLKLSSYGNLAFPVERHHLDAQRQTGHLSTKTLMSLALGRLSNDQNSKWSSGTFHMKLNIWQREELEGSHVWQILQVFKGSALQKTSIYNANLQ